MVIAADVDAVLHGAAESAEVAAREVDAARVGDAAVVIGSIEIRTAVFRDFDERAFVFARDLHEQIVETVRPDFPGEMGERAIVGVEIVDAGGVFTRAERNGGD